ncbi:MAG: GNAT family N-acetyltransferase [Winogradskyella sp.]|uniref:GNAT family N-acetyltransferase n=1 Tax=Winogradskyella sp. TaxID=1883156 RepID=UPI0017F20994|nr:GNAT family N-acetyltransferase [Winogradskyella sp.]
MEYHSDKFQDFSLMIYKNEKLVGLLPANIVDDIVYSHQGLTYGGLIHSIELKTTDYIECYKSILKYLNQNGVSILMLKDLPSIYLKNSINDPFLFLSFKLKAELIRTDLHAVVNFNNSSLSNSRKEGVKRGLKHQLRIEESLDFELFWNSILIPNLQAKHGVNPVHSLKEINLLKSRFKNNIRQFNVYHNDKIVAGTTIFETENVAHCQYISGNKDKNELGSLDFLHAHLIQNIFKEKKYFDFGTSNLNNGQNINQGLQFWKEGFGARSIPQGFYNLKTVNHSLLETILI